LLALLRTSFGVGRIGYFQGTGHLQKRVSPVKWVGQGFSGQWIRYPTTVHHQRVFVVAGWQDRFLQPTTIPQRMHGLGFRVPVVACAHDAKASLLETLALLLHFHPQQFGPVFPCGQQPPRKTFRGRGQFPKAGRGFCHNDINRVCRRTCGRQESR